MNEWRLWGAAYGKLNVAIGRRADRLSLTGVGRKRTGRFGVRNGNSRHSFIGFGNNGLRSFAVVGKARSTASYENRWWQVI